MDNKQKFKIGLLVSNNTLDYFNYELIQQLNEVGDIEFSIILSEGIYTHNNSTGSKTLHFIKQNGLFRTISVMLFKLQSKAERFILKKTEKDFAKYATTFDIKELAFITNELNVKAHYSKSGFVVRYQQEDLEKIKTLNLDLLIRINTPGIFKGEILSVAKHGLISFHHGDNRWNRGGPPGFWEVYYKKPATGFIIQILNEVLDAGKVVYRGEVPTLFFYELNKLHLFKESYPLMVLVIQRLIKQGSFDVETAIPVSDKLFKIPNFWQLVNYQTYLVGNVSKKIIRRIFHRTGRWSVAFFKGEFGTVKFKEAIKITNPKSRFFADPFVVNFSDKTVVFVEDYYYNTKKGVITAIEITDNAYKVLGTVVEEDFHLSYPFVFKYENQLYMIPESYHANAVRLYKCVDFPLKWEYQKELFSDVACTDTNIFEYDNRWWLFTNKNADTKSNFNKLDIYYTDNPITGEWKEHAQNPVVFKNGARNGGFLPTKNNQLTRISQKHGFCMYGKSTVISNIKKLTPDVYEEEIIQEILPDFFQNIKGTHHLHSNGEYTVFDYVKDEFVS